MSGHRIDSPKLTCWDRSANSRRGGGVRARFSGWSSRLLTILVILIAMGSANASTRPIRFERLTLEDGLSQNTVLTVAQDSKGFLWIGTEDGLNRYDGTEFVHYRHQRSTADPTALAGSYIWAVDEDSEGNLWIGTDGGGVARLRRADGEFTLFRHDPTDPGSLASDQVRTLMVDPQGAIWIGLRGGGLDRIESGTTSIRHFRNDPRDGSSLSNDDVYAIASDRSGTVWVGTDDGLNELRAGSGEFLRHLHDPEIASSLSDSQVRAVFEDRSGVLWVGTDKGGLNRFDRSAGSFERFQHDPDDPTTLSHDQVRTILEDDAQRLWIGTQSGLNLMDRQRGAFWRYRHDPAEPNSLSSDDIMVLFQDRGGLLWVGTKSGGLNKWNPRTWSFGHHTADPAASNSLSEPVVTSFAQDSHGQLWVGTMGGGLNRLNRATGDWRQYQVDPSQPDSLSDDRVMALLRDHQGILWIATMSGGLNRFDPSNESFRVYRHDPDDPTSLSADAIMTLFESRDGVIWIGTFGGGISRLNRDSQSFIRYTADPADPEALASPRVTSFAQDLTGAIWVGTDGGGLHLFDPQTASFHRYPHEPKDLSTPPSNTIYAIHADASGQVWIGSRGGGLSRVEGSAQSPEAVTFHTVTADETLINADVYGIESDSRGDLWLSTNSGLTRFSPSLSKTRKYLRSHGLQNHEFNFGAHYRSASGELFFGGINGFNAFYPNQLEENPIAPPVALTSVQVNSMPMAMAVPAEVLEEIRLGHRDDVVTFEFAALDFADPEHNRYAYKLVGFDDDWTEIQGIRRVTYTNLNAGSYSLQVRAVNSDGVWNDDGVSLAVEVAPAPWETWWAYGLYAVAALIATAVFVRAQMRKVEREAEYSRMLEADVRERTKELTERNSQLRSLNDQLLDVSLTDSLTGLRNRRFLFEEVAKDIALVRRRFHEIASGDGPDIFDLTFLMIDFDHFKSINDNCGHTAGDQVLVEIKEILLECCRTSDIVIRWGGDEFLIVARDTDSGKAEILAERIRSRVEARAFSLGDGQIIRTTCSVGFASFPFVGKQPDAVTWEQVLHLADSAMYEAKQTRNSWVGFVSTRSTLIEDGVLQFLRDTPEELVESGSLEVRRSSTQISPQATDSMAATASLG